MTTAFDLIRYLETNIYLPVLSSPHASLESRKRVLIDWKRRLPRLPVRSIALYIEHGAACDTPRRLAANKRLEQEGFSSYRTLVASMREIFADVWPT